MLAAKYQHFKGIPLCCNTKLLTHKGLTALASWWEVLYASHMQSAYEYIEHRTHVDWDQWSTCAIVFGEICSNFDSVCTQFGIYAEQMIKNANYPHISSIKKCVWNSEIFKWSYFWISAWSTWKKIYHSVSYLSHISYCRSICLISPFSAYTRHLQSPGDWSPSDCGSTGAVVICLFSVWWRIGRDPEPLFAGTSGRKMLSTAPNTRKNSPIPARNLTSPTRNITGPNITMKSERNTSTTFRKTILKSSGVSKTSVPCPA